jgi:cystathionine beta-lyase/cystathionine gamma-synthase
MTHASLAPQQPAELDITDDLLRLSVGIEEVEDLLRDLTCALDSVRELARLRTAS